MNFSKFLCCVKNITRQNTDEVSIDIHEKLRCIFQFIAIIDNAKQLFNPITLSSMSLIPGIEDLFDMPKHIDNDIN